MKTAMQELRNDILIEMQLGIIGEHSGNRVLHYIDSLYLEKEKEQICNAYTDGLEGPYIGAEQYYNQTYNQNK